jgi:hypothetical protein
LERSVLQQNIRLFRQRLVEPHDAAIMRTIRALPATAERRSALPAEDPTRKMATAG